MTDLLLSAKGGDVTSWRAATDFTASYRQVLLDRAISGRSGSTETVLSEACSALDAARAVHHTLLTQMSGLIREVATAPSGRLNELTAAFYGALYRHFGHFRSAPAFYQLSMTFLRQATAVIADRAASGLGPDARHLHELALVAVGPAGRGEYSPFCPLQIVLVHGETAPQRDDLLARFCQALHDGFEASGLLIDPEVTPLSRQWRGTVAEWRQRCEDGLLPQAEAERITLYRLVDQCPLYPAGLSTTELKQLCSTALGGSRTALSNLVERMASLSNGLSLMGRLKLERLGSDRGLFRLLDHGLLPLSAALSTLALIKGSSAVSSCERVTDLLKRRELDVELAERMLATWHSLHGLRLHLEHPHEIGDAAGALCLDPDKLDSEQLKSLKEALDSVAVIQRHVEIIFSGMRE